LVHDAPQKFGSPEYQVWFNGLFDDTKANYETICLTLRSMVLGCSIYVRIPQSHRSDIINETLVHAIENIGQFAPHKKRKDRRIWAYFRRLILRQLRRESVTVLMNIGRSTALETDEIVSNEMPDGLADARAARRKKARDIGRVLTHRIENVVDAYRNAANGQKRDLQLVMATLQDLRRELLGEFVVIRTPGLRYSTTNRLHEIGAD
jgi:hypothetical protein